MIVSIIGMCIGLAVLGVSIAYSVKEKADPEARKIYRIAAVVGAVIFVAMLVKLIVTLCA